MAGSRQLMSSFYALNKNHTVRLIIGIEYTDIACAGTYKVVARLTSTDFIGIPFSRDDWNALEANIFRLASFFCPEFRECTPPKDIEEPAWTAIFREGSTKKGVKKHIEFDVRHCKRESQRKRIKLDKESFACLQNITVLIADKFDYLNSIKHCVSALINEYIEFLTREINSNYCSRIIIDRANRKADLIETLGAKIKVDDIDEGVPFYWTDVANVLREVASCHMDTILKHLKTKSE